MPVWRLDDFTFEKIVVELRYDDAHLLWDRAGTFWATVKDKWPTIKGRSAKPNETVFVRDDKFEHVVRLDRSNFVEHRPDRDLERFVNDCQFFFSLAIDTLAIKELTRVGTRFMYYRPFASKEAAAEEFHSLGLIKHPTSKCFDIDGKPTLSEYTLRWEDADLGLVAKIAAVGRKTEFEPPLDVVELKATTIEKFGVVYDVDCYTNKKLLTSQLRISDWIQKVYRAVKRDSSVFFGR